MWKMCGVHYQYMPLPARDTEIAKLVYMCKLQGGGHVPQLAMPMVAH